MDCPVLAHFYESHYQPLSILEFYAIFGCFRSFTTFYETAYNSGLPGSVVGLVLGSRRLFSGPSLFNKCFAPGLVRIWKWVSVFM